MTNIIVRRESEEGIIEFRYNGSLTINVFLGTRDEPLDKFTEFDVLVFAKEPTVEEVIAACNDRIFQYAEKLIDSDLESLFNGEAQ